MTRPIILATGLACVAGAAMAQDGCASEADLARGIVLEFEDGTTETFRDLRPGVQSVEGADVNGVFYRLEIAQGTHLLDFVDVLDGAPDEASRQTYDYAVPVEELPVPVPGERFAVDVVATNSDGPRDERQSQAYVAGEPLVLGGCSYAVVEAVIAYDTPDGYMESINYLPELGIGYLLWDMVDGVQSEPTVLTAIRTGK